MQEVIFPCTVPCPTGFQCWNNLTWQGLEPGELIVKKKVPLYMIQSKVPLLGLTFWNPHKFIYLSNCLAHPVTIPLNYMGKDTIIPKIGQSFPIFTRTFIDGFSYWNEPLASVYTSSQSSLPILTETESESDDYDDVPSEAPTGPPIPLEVNLVPLNDSNLPFMQTFVANIFIFWNYVFQHQLCDPISHCCSYWHLQLLPMVSSSSFPAHYGRMVVHCRRNFHSCSSSWCCCSSDLDQSWSTSPGHDRHLHSCRPPTLSEGNLRFSWKCHSSIYG